MARGMSNGDERGRAWAEGRLSPAESLAFEAELGVAPGLGPLVACCGSSDPSVVPPSPSVRQQLLDLSRAPTLPIDVQAVSWDEPVPGMKVSVLHDDPERGVRGCLVWAQPGFRHFTHRHLGDELILVLDGELHDEHGVYRSGEICHSRAGSIHHEQVAPHQDCLAYVVYYGDLEPVGP